VCGIYEMQLPSPDRRFYIRFDKPRENCRYFTARGYPLGSYILLRPAT